MKTFKELSETLEQVDEISKTRLIDYMEKSKKETKTLSKNYDAGKLTPSDEKRFDRRIDGQVKALDKFHNRAKVPATGKNGAYDSAQKLLKVKEEVEQVNELSTLTLRSYVKKASQDSHNRAQNNTNTANYLSAADRAPKKKLSDHAKQVAANHLDRLKASHEKSKKKFANREAGVVSAQKKLHSKYAERKEELEHMNGETDD